MAQPSNRLMIGSRNSNPAARRWRYLKSVGPRYPLLMLKKVVLGRRVSGRDLLKFGGRGLEIGGPSRFFQSGKDFPIYSVAESMDNVNYSSQTFWEGKIEEGKHFKYHPDKPPGLQFILEASDLSAIPDGEYDFIASCHALEHCANPIRALKEWRRVLKRDGWFVLVLPHRAGTFDHRRAVTEFEHLVKDYSDGAREDDETHFAEILEKHDLDRDPAQESRESFEKWIRGNAITRGAHHHVFDPELAIRLVDHVGFEVAVAKVQMPFHIFIVAQKSDRSASEKEKARAQVLEDCCSSSPFRSDRQRAKRSSR